MHANLDQTDGFAHAFLEYILFKGYWEQDWKFFEDRLGTSQVESC